MTFFTEVNNMATALDFHLERQNLIAGNIANVDTPGFAPAEITRPDTFENSQFALEMKATDPAHYRHADIGPLEEYKFSEEKNIIPGNDLNYVSLDREMAKLKANTVRYEAVGKLVSKQLGILSYAANDGNR